MRFDQTLTLETVPPATRNWVENVYRGIEDYFALPDSFTLNEVRQVALWKADERRRMTLDERFANRLAVVLARAGLECAATYKSSENREAAARAASREWRDKGDDVLIQLYQTTGREFAGDWRRNIKAVDPADLDDPWVDNDDFRDWARNQIGQHVTNVSWTIKQRVLAIAARGEELGWSIDKIATQLASAYSFSRERSLMIARTEVIAASNGVSHFQIAQHIGAQKVIKTWYATNDKRTRPTHVKAHKQTRDMPDVFNVGGSELMFPGDGSKGASAKELIRCRCTCLYSMRPGIVKPIPPEPPKPPRIRPVRPRVPRVPKPKPVPPPAQPTYTSGYQIREALVNEVTALESETTRLRTAYRSLDNQYWKSFGRSGVTREQIDEARRAYEASKGKAKRRAQEILTFHNSTFNNTIKWVGPAKEKPKNWDEVVEWYRKIVGDTGAYSHPFEGHFDRRPRGEYAYTDYSTVHLHSGTDAVTTAHELGHLLERNKVYEGAMRNFRASRTLGQPLQSLRQLTGNSNFEAHEMTRVGNPPFRSLYIGKDYPSGHTEVSSMGLQYLWDDPVAFAREDPSHFEALMDALIELRKVR